MIFYSRKTIRDPLLALPYPIRRFTRRILKMDSNPQMQHHPYVALAALKNRFIFYYIDSCDV